jgi:hypothetical protein
VTAPTNTLTGATPNVGAREDLSDIIYRVAPEDTPFVSMLERVKATAITHEWQIETLASPNADNAQLEGDDVGTLDAANTPTRVKNICQIFRKTGGVSETQQEVKLAGRDDEMDRQKVIKGVELKTDMEARYLQNKASVAESGATTRKCGGLLAWIAANDSLGSGGTSGGFNTGTGIVDAAGNGTQRTFTEALLKAIRATGFSAGAKPSVAMMSGTHKQQFSAFTGIADIRREVKGQEQAVITAAADVYVDDFGSISLVPHAYAFTRDCVIIDPKKVKNAVLRPIRTKPLAKTGDSDRFIMTGESCLEVSNEKAHEAIRDLT